MEKHYAIYTEILFGKDWECINNQIMDVVIEKKRLAATLSSSDVAFSEVASIIQSLGCRRAPNELSEELQQEVTEFENHDDKYPLAYVDIFTVPYDVFIHTVIDNSLKLDKSSECYKYLYKIKEHLVWQLIEWKDVNFLPFLHIQTARLILMEITHPAERKEDAKKDSGNI